MDCGLFLAGLAKIKYHWQKSYFWLMLHFNHNPIGYEFTLSYLENHVEIKFYIYISQNTLTIIVSTCYTLKFDRIS